MPQRRDRMLREREHDTYKQRGKLSDPTACPECRATYHAGRWTWASPPAGAAESLCPACQRVRDDYPGGHLHIGGGFVPEHRDEILGLVRNVEEREKAAHPLKRIVAIRDEGPEILITTTDPHLARNLGDALHHAYRGELDYRYAEESDVLRVRWQRDETGGS